MVLVLDGCRQQLIPAHSCCLEGFAHHKNRGYSKSSILEENGVLGLFDGIYCNPLVRGEDGKIERLEKRTSTPSRKVSVLKESGVGVKRAIAVGTGDFWDKALLEECGHGVVRSYRDGFEGLVGTIEGFENLPSCNSGARVKGIRGVP